MTPIGFTHDFNSMISITILNSLGFFFLDFLIPFVASTEINATGSEMGVIFSVRTIGYFIIAPMAGSMADKYSKNLLILFGSVGRGIAYFMLYLAIIGNSLVVMIMGNFLLGLMAGFFWIPLDILVSVKSRKENRSEAFGRRSAAMGQGTLIGAIIGFGLLGFFNGVAPNAVWLIYSPLIVYGLGNFIAGIWFYWGVDEQLTIDEPVEENSRLSYWTYLKSLNRRFLTALLLIMTVLFLSSTNGSISKPFILVYLTENIESQPDLAAAAFIPSGITSMLLAPKLGKIADRLNIKIVISTGALAGALTTWLLISTSSLILFACLLVVDTTIATTTSLVIQNVVSRISLTNRGKIFGLQTLFVDFGAIIGPVIGGIFWDVYGQKSPFIFSIGVEILLIPVVILGISQIRPHLAEGLDH